MSLSKKDVWAELRVALDTLENPPKDTHNRLSDAVEGEIRTMYEDEESAAKFFFYLELQNAHSRSEMRNDTANSHEAIEKGLKAILLDSGLSEKQVRSRSHNLDLLLEDVKQHNPTAFDELERCFNGLVQRQRRIIFLSSNTNIVDYFRKHGKEVTFVANRYESIEGDKGVSRGMIPLIYREIIRALMSLVVGGTPKDIDSRIEEETRKAILVESGLDPTWDAENWLIQGPIRPRLEVIENLTNNTVLRAAVRRCARESKDSSIRFWAMRLRREYVVSRREARAERRIGYNPV